MRRLLKLFKVLGVLSAVLTFKEWWEEAERLRREEKEQDESNSR